MDMPQERPLLRGKSSCFHLHTNRLDISTSKSYAGRPSTNKTPPRSVTNFGLVYSGYLGKISPGKLSSQSPKKRRYVVLTNTALRWYKHEEGSITLKDINKVSILDEVTLELSCTDRKRAFIASDLSERDKWVESITDAMTKQRTAATAPPAADSAFFPL